MHPKKDPKVESGTTEQMIKFAGNSELAKQQCVLIFDAQQKCFLLERITNTVQLKVDRASRLVRKTAPPRASDAVSDTVGAKGASGDNDRAPKPTRKPRGQEIQ